MTTYINSESNSLITPKIPLTDEEASFQIIRQAVLGLWDVVNGLSTIKPPKRDRYCVTIFGSARMTKEYPFYQEVYYLASELTKMGCDIVTGGGPGLMEAANEGSVISDPEDMTQSIGIRIDLDFEQKTNPFVEQLYTHRTFFSRLHHFVMVSDAFVVVPGGIGTTLEALMIWQLLQVRKLHDTPLIMIGEMWLELVNWAETFMINVEPQLANPIDMKIPKYVHNVEDAIVLLRESQTEWKIKNP
jgi:uncharacterized protein (TIGR00730 family)